MTTDRLRKGTRGNIVFALSIFILFLLLFEGDLEIPVWLQPFGRMHAVVLHFPIAIILLAMILGFFRNSVRATDSGKFYQMFTRELLFTGVILSGVTVIMGIFLSREGDFSGDVLLWHKWAGISVFFLSAFFYSLMDAPWFSAGLAKTGAIAIVVIVILTGHFGGSLTHGDDFIWQPVFSEKDIEDVVVPVAEANVFEHVIKPVLARKCLSCHNEDKRKGDLLLLDSASVVKGGKTGKLFVAGDPDESLLLQRIHLPLEEKKHMPPSGKPQLSDEEQQLLYQWIKSGAGFSSKVLSLPETDSFRLIATRMLKEREAMQQPFGFPAADDATLAKLNSNYRVIRPVARNSPALTVNVYNRATYSPGMLEELKDVREQVVALDLSKMPVNDDDLKHVGRLKNLRKLNLNFTEITGKGLAHLYTLENLEDLSLAGTQLTFEDIHSSLQRLKGLKTVAVWETRLSSNEITNLRDVFTGVAVLGGAANSAAMIKLNPPRLNNKPLVFSDSLSLQLFHPIRDVDIRFTINGDTPDSLTSASFRGNTALRETASIKARAFKDGWLSSDLVTLNVYRCSLKPDTAILLSRLNRVHVANGAQTFFDRELGSFNANSPAWANNWAGFRNNDMELLLRYDQPTRIRSVSLNTLIETETSIFPHESLEVWGGTSAENLQLILRKTTDLPTEYSKPFIQLFTCEFSEKEVSYLKIIAKPVQKLPAWHKNKDKRALMLIDEILIN